MSVERYYGLQAAPMPQSLQVWDANLWSTIKATLYSGVTGSIAIHFIALILRLHMKSYDAFFNKWLVILICGPISWMHQAYGHEVCAAFSACLTTHLSLLYSPNLFHGTLSVNGFSSSDIIVFLMGFISSFSRNRYTILLVKAIGISVHMMLYII